MCGWLCPFLPPADPRNHHRVKMGATPSLALPWRSCPSPTVPRPRVWCSKTPHLTQRCALGGRGCGSLPSLRPQGERRSCVWPHGTVLLLLEGRRNQAVHHPCLKHPASSSHGHPNTLGGVLLSPRGREPCPPPQDLSFPHGEHERHLVSPGRGGSGLHGSREVPSPLQASSDTPAVRLGVPHRSLAKRPPLAFYSWGWEWGAGLCGVRWSTAALTHTCILPSWAAPCSLGSLGLAPLETTGQQAFAGDILGWTTAVSWSPISRPSAGHLLLCSLQSLHVCFTQMSRIPGWTSWQNPEKYAHAFPEAEVKRETHNFRCFLLCVCVSSWDFGYVHTVRGSSELLKL